MGNDRSLRCFTGPPCTHGGLVVWWAVAISMVLSGAASPVVGQEDGPPTRFAVHDLREDFAILRAALEEGHGGLYRYTPRAEMDERFGRARARLDTGMTAVDFVRVVSPVIAAINDGHTRIDLPPALAVNLAAQPILFPFRLAFVRGRAYLARDYTERQDAPMGAEVVAINGVDMPTILDAILRRLPSDGHVLTAKYRTLESTIAFGRWYNIVFGLTTRYEMLLRIPEGATFPRVEPGLTTPLLTARYERRYPESVRPPPPLALAFEGDIAVLTIRTFDRSAYTRAGVDYEPALSGAFAAVRDSASRCLIVDLRGNGGGTDEYASLVYAHLARQPFVYYRSLEVNRPSFAFLRYTDTPNLTVPADRIRPNDHGTFDLLGHPNLELQSPVEPVYAGPVIVLMDGGSFSATSELLSVMHTNRRSVFIGEESGGGYVGNTSGLGTTVTLPNTGVQVRIPLIRYTMGVDDDGPRDRGVLPDYEVVPTIDDLLAGRDVVLAFARALVRQGQ